MNMIDIGPLSNIPREGARVVKTRLGCVAVFRTATDQVFALQDRCPHKGGPLSEGIVHGTHVTCPLHNRVFDLSTGLGEGEVPTYAARVEGGRVLIDSTLLSRSAA
ncbi:nitrite reductase small subunit NirD [Falsirhodobacter sp. 20TX0035]|uniref:nitrite reductase small subunit NirD n=1 Tax=Falsirhodobacter sp. 20TX0035 TaxID=3022019 RepID=UPI00232DB4D2|nr:nitrite reductase small subunit NirD [Falsirhodobacter sp. 20TX0035]MDB6454063.1 nitrite reductase small subunit NirD [Falsirhodobacter sp. 20TX0035]